MVKGRGKALKKLLVPDELGYEDWHIEMPDGKLIYVGSEECADLILELDGIISDLEQQVIRRTNAGISRRARFDEDG